MSKANKYDRLICETVICAIRDYVKNGVKMKKGIPLTSKEEYSYRTAESFFHTEWFRTLTYGRIHEDWIFKIMNRIIKEDGKCLNELYRRIYGMYGLERIIK